MRPFRKVRYDSELPGIPPDWLAAPGNAAAPEPFRYHARPDRDPGRRRRNPGIAPAPCISIQWERVRKREAWEGESPARGLARRPVWRADPPSLRPQCLPPP